MKARVMVRLDWGFVGVWRARNRSVVKVSRDEGGGARYVDGMGILRVCFVAMLNLKLSLWK